MTCNLKKKERLVLTELIQLFPLHCFFSSFELSYSLHVVSKIRIILLKREASSFSFKIQLIVGKLNITVIEQEILKATKVQQVY